MEQNDNKGINNIEQTPNKEFDVSKQKPHKWQIVLACILVIAIIAWVFTLFNDKYDVIEDDYLKQDFINALAEIQADAKKIEDLEKIEDWAGGTRYQFTYDNSIKLIVYCNMGSTIESINYNNEKIYYRGYESYNINDYIFDSYYQSILQIKSEEVVSLYLNYPSTAKYSLLDWSYGRYGEIYYLSSVVEAANAFGVYSSYHFKIGYHLTEEEDNIKYKPVYLFLGEREIFNYLDSYISNEERKTVTPKYPFKNATNSTGINLIYGTLGTYGKKEIIDGETYIFYYVPSGKYLVTNNGNQSTIYVASDEMKRNSSGYLESIDIKIYSFEMGSNQKKLQIEVPEGYHIELSIHTNINLQSINT